MADMEKETKPILMPMLVGPQSHIQLTVPDQEKLAIWAYKTALMVGLIGPVRNIPPSTYRVFFDSGRALPADCTIWTAAYMGLDHAAYAGHSRLRNWQGNLEPTSPIEFHLTTFSALRCIFQVLGLTRGEWLPSAIESLSSFPVLRLWPGPSLARWWPVGGRALGDGDLSPFAQRSEF
jgi:hypothetical protein